MRESIVDCSLICPWVDNHSNEVTTEDLSESSLEVQQTADEEVASNEEEEMGQNVCTSEIKGIFSGWSKI